MFPSLFDNTVAFAAIDGAVVLVAVVVRGNGDCGVVVRCLKN